MRKQSDHGEDMCPPPGVTKSIGNHHSGSSRKTLIRSDLLAKPMPGNSGMTMCPSAARNEQGAGRIKPAGGHSELVLNAMGGLGDFPPHPAPDST